MKRIENGKEVYLYKIDVLMSGSFAVKSNEEKTEDEVLEACLKNDLFYDEDDINVSSVDEYANEYDFEALADCTHEI